MGGGVRATSNNKCWICDALYVPKYHQKLGCQKIIYQNLPKYHQKLGCQANGGGARRAPPPPLDPPMNNLYIQTKGMGYKKDF